MLLSSNLRQYSDFLSLHSIQSSSPVPGEGQGEGVSVVGPHPNLLPAGEGTTTPSVSNPSVMQFPGYSSHNAICPCQNAAGGRLPNRWKILQSDRATKLARGSGYIIPVKSLCLVAEDGGQPNPRNRGILMMNAVKVEVEQNPCRHVG
jgi:hypothetical protein